VVGDEPPLIEMISTTTTAMKASAAKATHRTPGRARLASRTAASYHRVDASWRAAQGQLQTLAM